MSDGFLIYGSLVVLLGALLWLGRKSRQKKHEPSIGTPIKQEEIEQWQK